MKSMDSMLQPFEIVVGTYEQYLLGYTVKNSSNNYELVRSFATHSHLASIRSVCSGKYFISSAGSDDSINLYDMRYRTESGKLIHHNDTVNCVAFTPDGSHLFSCSSDGTIAAVRCGNWQLEKHWTKPHKGLAVNTLAIHPSGKIALSIGADGVLRTWNLIKGRQAYATNLVPRLKLDAKNINILKWSPNGEKYLVAVGQRIDLYSVDLAAVETEIILESKIICVEFLNENLMAIGLENGQIKLYNVKKLKETLSKVAHDVRVKCIAHKDDLLITASSSGQIKLWRYTENSLKFLQSTNCDARITCLSVVALSNIRPTKENDLVFNEEQKDVFHRDTKPKLGQEVTIEYEDNNCVAADPKSSQTEQKCKKRRQKKRKVPINTSNECNNLITQSKGHNIEEQCHKLIESRTMKKKTLESNAGCQQLTRTKKDENKSMWIVEDNNVPAKKKRKKITK